MKRALGLDRSDLRFWALTFGPLLAVAVGLYAAAFLLVPAPYRFSGFLVDTPDSYSYLYWSRAFAEQGLLVDAPTSLTPQPGAYFNLVWYLFGKALQHTGVPFLVLYYGLGVVAGGAMYLLLLALMKTLVSDRFLARAAYLMAGFGTGLGWAVFLLSRSMFGGLLLTADFVHGDGFPVYSFWTFPHVSLSWCLLLVSVLLLFHGRGGVRPARALSLAAVALFSGFSHPYQVLILVPVFAVWYLLLGVRRGPLLHPRWVNLLAYAAGAAPALWFYHHLVNDVPSFAFLAEFPYRTREIANVAIGFAPFLLPALLGFRGFVPLGAFTDRYLLMASWALLGLLLQYAWPFFHNEGKLNQGWIIPLSVLGVWGLASSVLPRVLGAAAPDPGPDILAAEEGRPVRAANPIEGRKLAALVAAGALVFLPTTGVLMTHRMREMHLGQYIWFRFTANPRVYLHEDDLAALRWLNREARGRPLVLADAWTGLVLPGFAPVRVFWGHPANTLKFDERKAEALKFLKATATSEERRAFLRKYPVDLIYWGPDEFYLYGSPPHDPDILEVVYGKGQTGILRVRRERLAAG